MKKDESAQAPAYLPINKWAEEDRPREKLLLKGKDALSDAELLAILLGTGTVSMSAVDVAKQLLNKVSNNLNELARLSIKELQDNKGIGEAKAITIMSALELGRRRKEEQVSKKPTITCSNDAYQLVKPFLWDLKVEQFWILLLNQANQVMRKVQISLGGVTSTIVDPKVVFQRALEENAISMILVHNHPSGSLKPSEADRQLTKKIKDGGKLLDIKVLDHLIFTDTGYFSFADEGIMPN